MGSKITANYADWYSTVFETLTGIRGLDSITLKNYLSEAVPYIGAGSVVEVDGAIFEWTEDAPIYNYGLTLNQNNLYIKLVPSRNGLTAYFTEEVAAYDEQKRGFYKPNTSERFLQYGFEYNQGGGGLSYFIHSVVQTNRQEMRGFTEYNGNFITAVDGDTINNQRAVFSLHEGYTQAVSSSFQHPLYSGIGFICVHQGDLYVFKASWYEGSDNVSVHQGLSSAIKETKHTPEFFYNGQFVGSEFWTIKDSQLRRYSNVWNDEEAHARVNFTHMARDFAWDGSNIVTLDEDNNIRVHEGVSNTIKLTIPVDDEVTPHQIVIGDTYYTGHAGSFAEPDENRIYHYEPAGYKRYYQPSLQFPNVKIYSTGKLENS